MTHTLMELKEKEAQIMSEIKKIDTDIEKLKTVEEVQKAKAIVSLKTAKLDLVQAQLKAADQKPFELKVVEAKNDKGVIDNLSKKTAISSKISVKGVDFVIDTKVQTFFDKLQRKDVSGVGGEGITGVTSIGGGDAVLPKTVVRGIVELLKNESNLFSKVTVYRTLSNKWLQAVAENDIKASWTDEGAEIEGANPTTTTFTLGAYGLKKIVEITNEAKDWATQEFMAYIIGEIVSGFASAIEEAIIKGQGASSGQPEGITNTENIHEVTSAAKGEITYEEVAALLKYPKLKAKKGASLVMHPSTWATITDLREEVKDAEGNFISYGAFLFDTARKLSLTEDLFLRGVPVVLSEEMDTLDEAGEISIGLWNLREYVMNIGRNFKLEQNSSVGFKRDLHTYKATMALDGKVRRKEFFVNFKNNSTA